MDNTPRLATGVIDRVLALVGDGIVVGIVLLAVQLGALDHTTAIVMVGWALRSVLSPTITLGAIAASFGLPLSSLVPPKSNGGTNGTP